MQIEISREEAMLLGSALEAYTKEPHLQGMVSSILMAALLGKDARSTTAEDQQKAEIESNLRKSSIAGLNARIVAATANFSDAPRVIA